ncbi:hypothetical protein AbraIFM66951_001359 [Aspergillus brasiliensis]|uniref:Uncharacterized protein n=1 Tax=Aspergillus brasiliensis TaxID=319629 RepID=A0A9W5Z0Y8_9EURO|nr:hypothetical protein AbraCBS73388_001229 [Aspergillus brasiliensis]GKZ49102.1 hypothetical protein AbraIFM66951_001359 [Aspergillus brasiliensis]
MSFNPPLVTTHICPGCHQSQLYLRFPGDQLGTCPICQNIFNLALFAQSHPGSSEPQNAYFFPQQPPPQPQEPQPSWADIRRIVKVAQRREQALRADFNQWKSQVEAQIRCATLGLNPNQNPSSRIQEVSSEEQHALVLYAPPQGPSEPTLSSSQSTHVPAAPSASASHTHQQAAKPEAVQPASSSTNQTQECGVQTTPCTGECASTQPTPVQVPEQAHHQKEQQHPATTQEKETQTEDRQEQAPQQNRAQRPTREARQRRGKANNNRLRESGGITKLSGTSPPSHWDHWDPRLKRQALWTACFFKGQMKMYESFARQLGLDEQVSA